MLRGIQDPLMAMIFSQNTGFSGADHNILGVQFSETYYMLWFWFLGLVVFTYKRSVKHVLVGCCGVILVWCGVVLVWCGAGVVW